MSVVYYRPKYNGRRRTSALKTFLAPVGGWIANRNLGNPSEQGGAQGAAVLDNFFPTASSAYLRRGKVLYATLGDGTQLVRSFFSYVIGGEASLFASTDTTVFDITSVPAPSSYNIVTDTGDLLVADNGDVFGQSSTQGLDVLTGLTNGNWISTQFATTGGIYLLGVNGADSGFIYDGDQFFQTVPGGTRGLGIDAVTTPFQKDEIATGGTSGASAKVYRATPTTLYLTDVIGTFQDNEAITGSLGGAATVNGVAYVVIPPVTGINSEELSYVWVYKNRLFFIERNSLNVWYMDIDQIGGALTLFPMGGIFVRGGSLMFGASWSLDAGAQGGLSEQCIFATSEGEVAVFQGADPGDDWSKVGVYRIGKPLGNDAWFRDGGDILISTSIGKVRLSEAIKRELAALGPTAVSYPIEDAWNEACDVRGLTGWDSVVWPENQMAVVSPPATSDSDAVWFVANVRTGAWARYTNWYATAITVYQGRLYFGSDAGRVYIANQSGYDDGATYTGTYLPLFEDMGAPASLKVGEISRAVLRGTTKISSEISLKLDFSTTFGPPPDATQAPAAASFWATGIWGTSTWGADQDPIVTQEWKSVGGMGYSIASALRITSGNIQPLDAEIIKIDLTYQTTDVVT